MSLAALALVFFAASLAYASVGFGGGSAYLALLTLWGVPIPEVTVVALVCNVIVVAGGSWHFARAGQVRPARALPLLLASVPAAYLGGGLRVGAEPLAWMTGLGLAAAAVAMLLGERRRPGGGPAEAAEARGRIAPLRPSGEALVGGVIGGFSGVIGIGGGVFLAPTLYLTRWGPSKDIAAMASLFILLNSLAGLAGKAAWIEDPRALGAYVPLFVAVLVGGQIGSRLGARRLSPRWVRRGTAIVVLLAAANLLLRGVGAWR